MPSVFVRYREQALDLTTCILLHGDRAKQCLDDPQKYVQQEFDGGVLVDFWEVPTYLENATASGDIGQVFDALIALDVIAATPAVSDLLATVFEAGYRLGAEHKS